jgi:hypothetical protein
MTTIHPTGNPGTYAGLVLGVGASEQPRSGRLLGSANQNMGEDASDAAFAIVPSGVPQRSITEFNYE